eukprot:Selendium_serpulae@DN6243_c0_g2_i1.p1
MTAKWSSNDRLLYRIKRELEDVKKHDANAAVEVRGGNMRHWLCTMDGPPSTPYENQQFTLSIYFPDDYPFAAPEVKFVTKVWHPNISSKTGAICLSTLASGWCPAFHVGTVLLSIQALLAAPEPSDPMDAEVATMYKNNRPLFEETARQWAGSGQNYNDNNQKITKLVEMGFDEALARQALEQNDWDEGRASGWILDR